MYTKIYYTSFFDINENKIDVEIYKDLANEAVAKELTCTSDAIQINYESDNDIYKPLKCSDMQMNIYTDKVLEDLYTAKNDTYCLVKKNGNLFWYGLSTACLYQSGYVTSMDELALQFNDVISSLETVRYSYLNNNEPVSFYKAIKTIVQKIDKAGIIQNIYLHNALQLNGSTDLLNNLYVSERNFFDEEGVAENCKDVIESITKYLNSTCIQFGDSIYFIDYSSLDSIKQFTKYNLSDNTNIIQTVSDAVIDVNSNIFQSNGNIGISEQYNKIAVIANTNSANNTLPDMFEDLINENADPNKYYESNRSNNGKNYTILNAFFKTGEDWLLDRPRERVDIDSPILTPVPEVTPDNADNGGSYFQKTAYYESDNEPSSVNWQTILTEYGTQYTYNSHIIKLNKPTFFLGKGGVIIIDLKYKLSGDWNPAGCITTSDEVYKTTKYGIGYEDTRFKARLKIGNFYFDGENWLNWTTEYLPNKDYYEKAYVTIEEIYGEKHWYSHYNGVKKEITKEEAQRIDVKDGFYLVHKNKEDEKIFDTDYQLTNTVSWKFNLAASEDGVAIKLPNDIILAGNLEFTLGTNNMVGNYPCYRTDQPCELCKAVHISDFKMKYTTSDSVVDIFNLETYESDIKYENIIDDAIVKELDDILMKVNTYNPNAVSYSYVITNKNDAIDYVDKLTNLKNKQSLKSEEHYITKYVNYYSSMKYNYSNHIINRDIKPYSLFYESALKKNFVLSSVTYNLSTDSAEVTLKQI